AAARRRARGVRGRPPPPLRAPRRARRTTGRPGPARSRPRSAHRRTAAKKRTRIPSRYSPNPGRPGGSLLLRLNIPTRPVTAVTSRRKPFVAHLIFYTVVAASVLAVGQ